MNESSTTSSHTHAHRLRVAQRRAYFSCLLVFLSEALLAAPLVATLAVCAGCSGGRDLPSDAFPSMDTVEDAAGNGDASWSDSDLPDSRVVGSDSDPGGASDDALGGDAEEDAALDSSHGASSPDFHIKSVSPSAASFRGGELVRLQGKGFGASPVVRFGDKLAQTVGKPQGDSIDVIFPAAEAGGWVNVHVASELGETHWPGFRVLGIPPPKLHWVELPNETSTVDAIGIDILMRPEGPRLVWWGAGALRTSVPAGSGAFSNEVGGDEGISALGSALPTVTCAGDFDGDGRQDLWVASADGAHGVWLDKGSVLAAPIAAPPLAATAAFCGDFTKDGLLDVAVVVSPPGGLPALRVLEGDGGGGLALLGGGLTLGGTCSGLVAADVNGDGALDILVGRADAGPRLLLGDGFGAFTDAPAGTLPQGLVGGLPAVGDMDGDGLVDAVWATPVGLKVWRQGQNSFGDKSGLASGLSTPSAERIWLLDVDVDGALDVLVQGAGGAHRLFRNDGQGRLFDYSHVFFPWPLRGAIGALAPADWDGDGDPDLALLRADGRLSRMDNWDPLPFADTDADGIVDLLDGCPEHANPDQANRDQFHFSCPTAEECTAQTGCALHVTSDVQSYLVCPTASSGQLAARAFCASRGGSLLLIDSLEELMLVAEVAPGRAWLDLSDLEQEGVFVTSTGAPMSFWAWGNGQPDNAGDAEHCVELNANNPLEPFFNDLPCDTAGLFTICEDVPMQTEPDPQDACDVCPLVHDPLQLDSSGNGVGDACEPEVP